MLGNCLFADVHERVSTTCNLRITTYSGSLLLLDSPYTAVNVDPPAVGGGWRLELGVEEERLSRGMMMIMVQLLPCYAHCIYIIVPSPIHPFVYIVYSTASLQRVFLGQVSRTVTPGIYESEIDCGTRMIPVAWLSVYLSAVCPIR